MIEPQRHKDTKILGKISHAPPALANDTQAIASAIVDSAYKVHSAIGPGLMESVYEACMSHELAKRRIPFQKQVSFPIVYDGLRPDTGLRLDLLVSKAVIVELKAVELMHPVFEAQVLSYLKLTGLHLGLLINFNVPIIKQGIKRIII